MLITSLKSTVKKQRKEIKLSQSFLLYEVMCFPAVLFNKKRRKISLTVGLHHALAVGVGLISYSVLSSPFLITLS